ncbi:hypothetical protein EAE96_001481 [Botrytis aclada]|nr:hypothetical protein EAE96_001481 [Botrytis aclada]
MTRYGFSNRQRARKEARTLPHPHSTNEVPSPCNEPNVPNESAGADESGGKKRVAEDDRSLKSMINSIRNDDLPSDDNNNVSSRSASPVRSSLSDLSKDGNTTNADGILAEDDTTKSKDDPDVRQSSNTITDLVKHENAAIRCVVNVIDKITRANGNRFMSLPRRLKSAMSSKSKDEELTAKRPTKTWVSRFKDSQKGINPHKRRKYKMKATKDSVRKRILRRLEYRNLGIELSYAEVKRAEWKLRNHKTVDPRIGITKKPPPGYSNLRYCLTYLKQVQDSVSDYRSSWIRQHRQLFPSWSTVRAAASCLGV